MRLLPLNSAYFISDLTLTILQFLLQRKLRLIQDVFNRFFPDCKDNFDAKKLSFETLRLSIKNQIDVMRYPLISPKNIDQYVDYEGLDNLDLVIKSKKGVILMFGHFGANQFIIPALGHKGYPINQISTFPGAWEEISGQITGKLKQLAYKCQRNCESHLPVNFLDIRKSIRPALRCLEQGEILLVAFDGRGGSKWEKVDYLNHKANLTTIPCQIAVKTGASILPVYIMRKKNKHILKIEKPIYSGGDEKPEDIIREFVKWFEPIVKMHPEHYLWLLQAAMIRGKLDEVPLFDLKNFRFY